MMTLSSCLSSASLLWLSVSAIIFVTIDCQDQNTTNNPWAGFNDTVFEDCEVDTFYSTLLSKSSDPTKWDRSDIISLLTQQHRNVLPVIGGGNGSTSEQQSSEDEDITSALTDLFPGSVAGTVRLWFRDIDMKATPVNTPESWRRGDVWPLPTAGSSANVTTAMTDVHVKRPVDWTVNDVLRDLKMGTCGTVQSMDVCTSPATTETANDTSQDGKIKEPPAASRGDVARSLFYNALRYEVELGLRLTDCPPFNEMTDYAYLSPLLEWHNEDPVDDIEVARNNRACSRWQGNRNIFVDYPELVPTIFGLPDTIQVGTNLYTSCIIPTNSPTASPNACSAVRPGDVQVFLFNSNAVPPAENPNGQLPTQVVFFTLDTIPADVDKLYVTDRGWNGTDFVTDEGTVEYTIPDTGIDPGKVFAYGVKVDEDKGTWANSGSNNTSFLLGDLNGDNILLYCLNADNIPHFIAGAVYNQQANWTVLSSVPEVSNSTNGTDPDVPQLLFNESVLPERLVDAGSVALSLQPNYLYVGPQSGKRVDLIEEFRKATNYNGSTKAFVIDTSAAAHSPVRFFRHLSATLFVALALMVIW